MAQKEQTISKLNQEINQFQQEISKLKKEISKGKNQKKSVDVGAEKVKNDLIEKLKQQVTAQQQQIQSLQGQYNQIVMNQHKNSDLQNLNQQQKVTISGLENKIAQLQSLASIGSHTLNKWRSKMYN